MLAINVIVYAIIKRYGITIYGLAISLFASVVLFFLNINDFGFTRTAGVLIGAGICLMYHGTKKEFLLGGTLFIIGAMIRYEVIAFAPGFFLVIWIFEFTTLKGRNKERLRTLWNNSIKKVLMVWVVCFILLGINQLIVKNHNEWNLAEARNTYMSNIMDYEMMPYDEKITEYVQLGITENDYGMLVKRFAASDPHIFNNSLLQQVSDNFSLYGKTKLFSSKSRSIIVQVVKFSLFHFGGWITICLFTINLFIFKKKNWIVFINGIMILLYLLFFMRLGRINDEILYILYFYSVIVLFLLGNIYQIQNTLIKKFNIFFVLLLVIIGTITLGTKNCRIVVDYQDDVLEHISAHKDNYFIYTRKCLEPYLAIHNLFVSDEYMEWHNSFYTSVNAFLPAEIAGMKKYGITNIYKDSINSDVVRFVDCGYIQRIIAYLNEHYDQKARAILDAEYGSYKIYKIVSE